MKIDNRIVCNKTQLYHTHWICTGVYTQECREELPAASKQVVYSRCEATFNSNVESMLSLDDTYAQYFRSHWLDCTDMSASYCRQSLVRSWLNFMK